MTNNAINSNITNIIIDSSLVDASNNNIPSTLAIKDYIDSLSSGSIVQRAIATRTDGATSTAQIPSDDTTPQQSEGTEFLNVSITPQSASSLLLVEVFLGCISVSTAGTIGFCGALFRDATADSFGAAFGSIYSSEYLLRSHVIAGSTDETIFKFRFGRTTASGTVYCNTFSSSEYYGAAGIAYLQAVEISI